MNGSYKIALCQMMVTAEKEQNMQRAGECVEIAAGNGAQIICLPEIWICPYDVKLFGSNAEPENGPAVSFMSDTARKHGVYLIGGSIPEQAGHDYEKNEVFHVYNTSFVFSPTGEMIAKHRKVHLFDIDIENGIRFKESDFFSAGETLTLFDTKFGKIGLAICFDLRFPEMFRTMAKKGAEIIFLPASFNMTTGPVHWELLIKSRALDNQLYLAACASARNKKTSYLSWGHSCVATPWGELSAAADEKESIIYATIDPEYIKKVRKEIPIGN
jgi:predicted amidohydrolase